MTIEEFLEAASTSVGAKNLSCEQLKEIADELRNRGKAIQSMEAFEFISENSAPLRTDFSILGLDGAKNWELHQSPDKAASLVYEKIKLARSNKNRVFFDVWIAT